MSWDVGILDTDWFKFRPIKIELKIQNFGKKFLIRNQRIISRIMFNLGFLVP
jgi:hypothetical protein